MTKIDKGWDVSKMGNLAGKRALVTGANSGIGLHTALELGRAGAEVILASRDERRGKEALAWIQSQAPQAKVSLELVDLASLSSVRSFAERFLTRELPLDILVNNAGVMALPERELTVDGYERQFATNHLGHFLLTQLLLPALKKSAAPRVVTLSSGMAYIGKLELQNLQSEQRYSPNQTYANTKLANLLFALELGRREPWLTCVAAHPGASHTNLQKHINKAAKLVMKVIGQSSEEGALPSLYAASGPVEKGEFIGPRKMFNMNGSPTLVRLPRRAKDADAAKALWNVSEELTSRHASQVPARS